MRLVVLSYSHHGRGMGRAARELGHEIVGVMDAAAEPRLQLEREFDCPGFDSAAACLEQCRPDAALVAGKHIEIPSHLQACLDRQIPYLVDKPFADCAERLRPVAAETARRGLFSALVLPNRASKVVAQVIQLLSDGSLGNLVLYNSRLNNGPPSRYDPTPSAWHNDAAISGGGSWAVEAAHGIDTFLQLIGERKVTVVGGLISNATHGRAVEDIALGILRTADGITGIVESGFCYPAGARSGDHFFRFVGTKASVFAQYGVNGEPLIELHTTAGVSVSIDSSHNERFRGVIDHALTALAEGRAFTPNIQDAVRILEIQDAVYDYARTHRNTAGPHPLDAPPPRPTSAASQQPS